MARMQTKMNRVPRESRGLAKAVGTGFAPNVARLKAAGGNETALREGLGNILDLVKASKENPWWNMDVVEQVRWTMMGPQTDQSVQENFGATIDLFASGKSPSDIDFVETTMAQPGETQTHFVACYVGFHLEPDPIAFTTRGNAWTHPTTGSAQPPSPDVFTANDVANGALGTAFTGGTPSQQMIPANMEQGWWWNIAFWELARSYNFRWKIGQHTNIMDEQLRHTAYMPPNAQEGSASSSEVDIMNLVRQMNQRYDSLGTALSFLPVDFLRIGSVGSAPNIGRFMPSRDYDTVGVTYGGSDLRSMLKGNSEFRQLCIPYVIEAGVPIGIFLQECDSVQGDRMRAYLAASQIGGTYGGSLPPMVTPDVNINSGFTATGSAVMLERTLDGLDVPQQVNAQRAIFKSGVAKITLPIKGFEVTRDWYNQLSNDQTLRNIVLSDCGVRFAGNF